MFAGRGGKVILELGEFAAVARGEDVGAGGEHLAEFHEGWAEGGEVPAESRGAVLDVPALDVHARAHVAQAERDLERAAEYQRGAPGEVLVERGGIVRGGRGGRSARVRREACRRRRRVPRGWRRSRTDRRNPRRNQNPRWTRETRWTDAPRAPREAARGARTPRPRHPTRIRRGTTMTMPTRKMPPSGRRRTNRSTTPMHARGAAIAERATPPPRARPTSASPPSGPCWRRPRQCPGREEARRRGWRRRAKTCTPSDDQAREQGDDARERIRDPESG